MLHRALLAALVCLAVWASGHRSDGNAIPWSVDGVPDVAVTEAPGPLPAVDGHAGNPARSNDTWQNAGAIVVVQTPRLDGHHADVAAGAPANASRVQHAAAPTSRRAPPARSHTFDLPLLI